MAKKKKVPKRCKICGKLVSEGRIMAYGFAFCSQRCLQKHLMRPEKERSKRW